MPNLESIRIDGRGITRWTTVADIPFVGKMRQSFAVDFLTTNDVIEWLPSPVETSNYLRCVAEMGALGNNLTSVRFSQNVELRRNKANELHSLAGLAGELKISRGLQVALNEMLKIFTDRAKEKIENGTI